MNRLSLLALAAATLAPLSALTITQTATTTSTVPGLTSTITFTGSATTDPAGHATYTLAGAAGFNAGTGLGTGDFLSIDTGGSATINFDQPVSYFGLNWSTTDTYNTIQFFNGATPVAGPFTGAGIAGGFVGATYVNFAFDGGEVVNRIVLASTGSFFESDNHSYITAAPEPGTVALVLSGVALVAIGRRRSRG